MDRLVQRPGQSDELLPPGTRMINVYDDMGRALLILGAPGSGKTTTLPELLRDLLIRAENDATHPIPVVFPLSTWAERRLPLAAWIVEELRRRYHLSRKLAQRWISEDHILPLFDGPDELAEAQREACVRAINIFRQDRGLLPMVICSRTADYEVIHTRLQLQGAIAIQPLSAQQVDDYFNRAGDSLVGTRQALQDDPELWQLLDTPLMLSIFTLAYAGQPVTAMRAEGLTEERRRLYVHPSLSTGVFRYTGH